MKIVVLAGGSGKRLWPLSRTHFPKQFLKLDGKESLLCKTVQRNFALVSCDDVYIMTHKDYFHEVMQEAPEIPSHHILIEPSRKNTTAAIGLAMKFLEEEGVDENEEILVVPSDHVIAPVEKYVAAISQGISWAKKGFLVVFGVAPHKPETGYGYIKALDHRVECFVEKPSKEKAQEYLLDGHYYWNAGIFLFTLKTMRQEMALHAPEIARCFQKSYTEVIGHFDLIPEKSIDYAVMEKSTKAAMIPLNLAWSDVGSWENIYEMHEKDALGNVVKGAVEAIDTTNSLLFSENRLISTLGVDNLLVVETKDAVLVAHKASGQKVRELVEKLQKGGKKEADDHLTNQRPWGAYTVLEEQQRYKIKKIEVKPQAKLSLQLHYHRSEHWVVVKGTAKVTISGKEIIVHEGESIFVPKTAIHRVENPGKVSLEIIEVQVGEYLGEDDIVRLEDVYGRLKEEEAFKLLISSKGDL